LKIALSELVMGSSKVDEYAANPVTFISLKRLIWGQG
jgi:hypothetical protein